MPILILSRKERDRKGGREGSEQKALWAYYFLLNDAVQPFWTKREERRLRRGEKDRDC
jgi:hypothetical protein